MQTTEELLAQMEAEAQSETAVCIIDPETRTITVPPEYQLLGVENDKRVERLYFQCPKIVGDNQDLSQDYILFINYVNANGDPDAYKINDMQVENENITFSWLLEEKVTLYRGSIQISFCGIIPGDEREDPDKNRWGTTINTDCTVLTGLKCTQQVAESNPDALAQIWAAIDELKAGGGGAGTPGKDGREIELQNSGTAIQWRYVGDDDWTDLVQLSDITGAKGDPGENGITPTIGENGNWYLGETDTGKPSRGEKGDPGQKGDSGQKGDPGQTGATPNIQIGTVQTLDPGQQATASMSGTAENPLLNLGIPKGEKGDSDGAIGANKVLSDSSEWINGNFIYQNEKSVIFDILQNRITTKYINEINSSRIKVECNSGYRYRVLFFTEIKNVNDGSGHGIVAGGYDDYSTWHENNRTLVVPEEARGYAVCMSKTDDSNMNTSECENISIYEISGDFDNTENILQNIFEQYNGKTLSILGDSISTYSGYIPDDNRSRYPEGDVDSVDKTYWKKIIDTLGMKLGVNESWAGSLVSWDGTTESSDIGEDKYIASENRISRLDDNGTPDIILIFAGTNDIGHEVEIGEINNLTYAEDVSNLSVSTFSESYTAMIMRVQYYYPKSKILVLTPCFAKYTSYTSYTPDRLDPYIKKIIEVCEIMGVDVIDTRKIGFNMYNIDDFTIDGLHPNAKGMELLSDSILKKMWFKF